MVKGEGDGEEGGGWRGGRGMEECCRRKIDG